MRTICSINNVKSKTWGLLLSEAYVFAWLYELSSWADSIIVKNESFYYCAKTKVSEELPMASSKPDTIYRIMKSLEKKGLILNKKFDGKDYVRLTELGKTWNDSRVKSDNSEMNPSKLGNESENNSDLNPTYNNIYSITINNNITKYNLADFLKKSEKSINSHLKSVFLAKYKSELGTDFYFTAKESGKLAPIVKKIIFKMKEKSSKEFFEEEEIIIAIDFFIKTSWEVLTDYEKSKYSLTIIDSNFNDIFVKIKNKSDGKQQITSQSKSTGFKYDVPDPRKGFN